MFSANTSTVSGGPEFLWTAEGNFSAINGTFSGSRNIEFVGSGKYGSNSCRNLAYVNNTNESGYVYFTTSAAMNIPAGSDFGMGAWVYVYGGDSTWLNFFGISDMVTYGIGIGNDFARGPFMGYWGGYLTSGYGVPLPRDDWFYMSFECFNNVFTTYINGTPYQAAGLSHPGWAAGSTIYALNNAETIPIGYPNVQNQFAVDNLTLYKGAKYMGNSYTPPAG